MKNIYFTSDLHYGHSNIIKYCLRPYENVQEMNKALQENWNNVVDKDDTIYQLGDFCFGGKPEIYLQFLNGNIIHILGNHDKPRHIGILEKELNIQYNGLNILLIHNIEHVNKNIKDIDLILCGHVHEKWKFNNFRTLYNIIIPVINVGVDVWNYAPVDIDEIVKVYKEYFSK